MKLNVGCGKDYKPNFHNIDFYEDLIADKIMLAIDLEFDDNVSEEIQAIHVIEHLSYFEAIYALSEFFRVLKPNGKLILEIPDIEKTCQIYLKANEDQKKEILGWIYGIPHKGLQHKFCFPIDFLIETLSNIGFKNISTKYYFNNESIPSIRINSIKTKNDNSSKIFQMIADLRKKIISENIVDFTDSFTTKEKEDLIQEIKIKSFNLKADSKKNSVLEILIDVLIRSPKIAKFYFLNLKEENLFSSSERKYLYDTIESLISLNFPNILFQAVKKLHLNPGTQQLVNFSIESYAKSIIKKLLDSKEEKQEILRKLENKFGNVSNSKIDFFSDKILHQKSLDWFYKGIKFFYIEDFRKAFKNFLEAIRLYRDDYLYYWNLARVLVLLNKEREAFKYYRWTKKLAKLSKFENKKMILQQLKNEYDWLKTKKGLKPKFEPIIA